LAPEVSLDEGFQREAETSINDMFFWLYQSNFDIHITTLPETRHVAQLHSNKYNH